MMTKYLIFLLILLFIPVFNVNAMDYTVRSEFAGISSLDDSNDTTTWISPRNYKYGAIYYSTPFHSKQDFIVVTYCSTATLEVTASPDSQLSKNPYVINTGQLCSSSTYDATLYYAYFSVKYWKYTSDNTFAYIDTGQGTFRNASNWNASVNVYGLQAASSIDVSSAILAYLKSNESSSSGGDYTSILNDIKNNQGDYKNELNQVESAIDKSNGKLDEVNKNIGDLNDSITSQDTTDANNSASGFFNDFTDDDYGLSDIITMPLQVINSLTSSSCVALDLNVPFVNKKMSLPCMSSIYSQYFSDAYSLYQTATTGFVAYWVIVKIYALIKGFKNPDDDKIEVMDL